MTSEEIQALNTEAAKGGDALTIYIKGLKPTDPEIKIDGVKKFLSENDEGKNFINNFAQKSANTAVENFKKDNLQKLIDEEYLKKHPEDESKNPEVEKLTKQLAQMQKESKIEKVKSSALKTLTEKKLPSELVDFVVNEDETKANSALASLENIFKTHDEALKADFIKGNMYTPGGDPNGGDKPTGGYAKQIADNMAKTNTNLEQARESYFK